MTAQIQELIANMANESQIEQVPIDMGIEKTYPSLHSALRNVMKPGEDAKIVFCALSTGPGPHRVFNGDLDIRKESSGRITYVTMPFKRLGSIHRRHGLMSVNLRVFDKDLPKIPTTCGNPSCSGCGTSSMQPQKRLYGFLWNSDQVMKLTAEECMDSNCVNSLTGETMEPEPGCHYM